jgi:hypothetical protein
MRTASLLALALVASVTATAYGGSSASRFPDGVYRTSWTENEAIAAGAPYRSAHADFGFAQGRRVVITITFRAGGFSLRDTSRRPTCTGSYTASTKSVSIHERPPACRGDISASWSMQGRQLRLHVTRATDPGDAIVFGAKPWRKVG